MTEDIAGLRKIGNVYVPGNPAGFLASKFIRSGAPGIRGVGGKLAQVLDEHAPDSASGGTVAFYLSSGAEAGEIPEALRDISSPLNWWQIHWFLQWPGVELYKALRYKDQVGCLAEFIGSHRTGRSRAIRIKLDWKEGHSLGGRPTDQPDWTWKEGTIFAVHEPQS